MSNTKEIPKVVTTGVAAKMLRVSRTHFYNKYIKKLTVYKSKNGHHNIYLLSEINEILAEEEKNKGRVLDNYEIVK